MFLGAVMLQRIAVPAPGDGLWLAIKLFRATLFLLSMMNCDVLTGDIFLGNEIWGKGCQGVLGKGFFLPKDRLQELKSYFPPLDVAVCRCWWLEWHCTRDDGELGTTRPIHRGRHWGRREIPVLFERLLSCWISWSYFASRLLFYVRW